MHTLRSIASNDLFITRTPEEGVPSKVQFGVMLLHDEPEEFWDWPDSEMVDMTARWLISGNVEIQASLQDEFSAESLALAQVRAQKHLTGSDHYINPEAWVEVESR